MNIVIGFLVVIFSVFGGFVLSQGQLLALWQPYELLIIGGAALGAFFIANPLKVVGDAFKALPAMLKGARYDRSLYMDVLALLFELFSKSRKEGLMAVENDIEEPAESELFKKYPKLLGDHHVVAFICDYMRMVISGSMNAFELGSLMEADLEAQHRHAAEPAHALTRVADALPGFGIVAAVLGIVITMSFIGGPPEVLGIKIAHALVGSFLGIFLAYGFVAPTATFLQHRADAETQYFQCIKACVLASVQGYSPQVAVEFGRKSMPIDIRPGFQELEDHVKGKG
jgi:chemotaxis protein MotA